MDVTHARSAWSAWAASLDPGLDVPRGATSDHDSQTRNSFYHAHWYANPILTGSRCCSTSPCLEKGLARPRLSHRGRSAVGRRRAHRHPEPGSGAVRQRTRKAAAPPTASATAGFADREPVLVRRLPGLDLPDGWPRRHPHRRRAGLAALITQRMTAKMHRQLVTFTGAGSAGLRLLPAADHGQDPLQSCRWSTRCRPPRRTPASAASLRPHDDDLGRGQVLPGVGRGLRVPDLPQEELLCRRVLRSAPSSRLPARWPAAPPVSRSRPGAALARRRRHRAGTESPPFPQADRLGAQPAPRRRA